MASPKAALRKQRPPGGIELAHIIAPVPWPSIEQEFVYRTMALAKETAERKLPSLFVSLFLVQVQGDSPLVPPPAFTLLPPVRRSTRTEYKCKKAIPFVGDVIQALWTAAPKADYYVLSNADINPMPNFYLDVHKQFKGGAQGFDILKVLVPVVCDGKKLALNLTSALDWARRLPQMHPGHDCFAWRSQATRNVIRLAGPVFFGFPPVGAKVADAIRASVPGRGFRIVRGQHWTFHLGLEGTMSGHGQGAGPRNNARKVEQQYPHCSFSYPEQASKGRSLGRGRGKPPPDGDCNYFALNRHGR